MTANKRAESVFLGRMLPKHAKDFDLGDIQFFERLESDLDRALFLGFKIRGIADSANEKALNGGKMNPEEEDFCRFSKSVFRDSSPDEFLQRPRRLPMGWMNEYLTFEERQKVKARLYQELYSRSQTTP